MTTRNLRNLFCATAIIAGALALKVYAGTWTITDIGSLDGRTSTATGINNAGQVVGSSTYSGGGEFDYHPFRWQNGTMTDLGVLDSAYLAMAQRINATGQVTGWSKVHPYPNYNVFIWQGGTMTDLGRAGGSQASGFDINASGWIAGVDNVANAIYWNGTSMIDMDSPTPPVGWIALYEARGINDNGTIVGNGRTTDFADRAFVYDTDTSAAIDVGTLADGNRSWATAISNSGYVVGWAETGEQFGEDENDVTHAFRWQSGVLTDVGTLGGGEARAYDVSEAGQVVGTASYTMEGEDPLYAFLWDSGVMTDLNDLLPEGSGWVLRSATGINDLGQIVGWGRLSGVERAFLLTPPQAACCPCDANCDGSVNLFDIQPFIDLLTNTSSPCSPCSGDTDSNGSINLFDIQGMVNCIGANDCAP